MVDPDCLGLKIMSNVEIHLKSDPEIDEYDILPVLMSEQNRNPVRLVEHKLGIESWGAELMFHTAAKEFGKWLKMGRKPFNSDWLLLRTMCILLIAPDHSTAWNIRRELITKQVLKHSHDLRLTKLILTKHPKSSETFFHRRWLLSNFPSLASSMFKAEATVCSFPQDTSSHCQVTSENANEIRSEIESSAALTSISAVSSRKVQRADVVHSDQRHCLVLAELSVCQQAAERYRNNYNAWTHRIWVNQHLSCCHSQVMGQELEVTKGFVCSHISDHSGYQYRQFLIQSLSSYGRDVSELLHNELLITTDLISTYPGHEAIWYHRRFVLEHMLRSGSFLAKEFSSTSAGTKEDGDTVPAPHALKRTRLESVALGRSAVLSSESDWCRSLLEGFGADSWQQTLVSHHLRWLNHSLVKPN